MKNGIARFEFYLEKVEVLLQLAIKEPNPALWLYKNDARTPLFMLEALSRMYSNLHNNKKFSNLNEHFKLLEDGIGSIDFYDNYAKIFLEHPTVPVHLREYMQAQAREKIQYLNEILVSNKWIGDTPLRIEKIKNKLLDANWLKPKDEAKALKAFYLSEIEKVKLFAKEADATFTQMETQVHELRRDMRWLSIYPQALQGMIQLSEYGNEDDPIQKYLTPEIINSKYNVMPAAGSNGWFLIFDKNYFLSLSWMIAALGRLKDEGLQFFAITEALQQTEAMQHDDAYNKSFEILGKEKDTVENILSHAYAITREFINEANLDKMITGLTQIKKSK